VLFHRLGHGDEKNQLTPKLIGALKSERICAVSAGTYHSMAMSADGTTYGWGCGEDAALGMQPADHNRICLSLTRSFPFETRQV